MVGDSKSNNIYIRFFIKGEDIDPDEISNRVGIIPAYKYKSGDLHGKNNQMVRKIGLWSITSSGMVNSSDLQLHIEWLLDILEPVKNQLNSIISKPDVYAEISCIFNLFSIEWDSRLEPSLLDRIAALNIKFRISIYCLDNLDSRLNDDY
jgi:hypothetical protein